MKRFDMTALLLSMACMMPFMASCGSDNDPGIPSGVTKDVTVSAIESLSVGASAQTIEVAVTANADWAIRTEEEWVSLRPSGGVRDEETKVRVSVTANTGFDKRSASLNIISGGNTVKTITLTQGYEFKADVNVSSLTFGAQESTSVISVNSNTDWELTSSENWVSAVPSKGGKGDTDVTVRVTESTAGDTREAVLVLKYGDSSKGNFCDIS